MMIRKDTLIYKLTQLHWFLLLTIIAMAMFGSLMLWFYGFALAGALWMARQAGHPDRP